MNNRKIQLWASSLLLGWASLLMANPNPEVAASSVGSKISTGQGSELGVRGTAELSSSDQASAKTTQAVAKASLQQRLAELQSFKANFKQQIIDSDGSLLGRASGELTIAQPELLRWATREPDEQLLVSDGRSLWLYDVDLEQVVAVDAEQAISTTPFALLTSRDSQLWQQYQVAQKGDNFYITPVDGSGQVKRLVLLFNQQLLSELWIEDRSGQKTEFSFSDQLLNRTVSPALFQFSLPDGVEFDDQRTANGTR